MPEIPFFGLLLLLPIFILHFQFTIFPNIIANSCVAKQ
eukprot:06032.XXX_90234_90347_1 [CDS] Oithona nana genome sequencing.